MCWKNNPRIRTLYINRSAAEFSSGWVGREKQRERREGWCRRPTEVNTNNLVRESFAGVDVKYYKMSLSFHTFALRPILLVGRVLPVVGDGCGVTSMRTPIAYRNRNRGVVTCLLFGQSDNDVLTPLRWIPSRRHHNKNDNNVDVLCAYLTFDGAIFRLPWSFVTLTFSV